MPIQRYRTQKQLFKAFLDFVLGQSFTLLLLKLTQSLIAHRDLIDLANILHRDISPSNMLLADELGGLLIDLDYAIFMKRKNGDLVGPRGVRTVSLRRSLRK